MVVNKNDETQEFFVLYDDKISTSNTEKKLYGSGKKEEYQEFFVLYDDKINTSNAEKRIGGSGNNSCDCEDIKSNCSCETQEAVIISFDDGLEYNALPFLQEFCEKNTKQLTKFSKIFDSHLDNDEITIDNVDKLVKNISYQKLLEILEAIELYFKKNFYKKFKFNGVKKYTKEYALLSIYIAYYVSKNYKLIKNLNSSTEGILPYMRWFGYTTNKNNPVKCSQSMASRKMWIDTLTTLKISTDDIKSEWEKDMELLPNGKKKGGSIALNKRQIKRNYEKEEAERIRKAIDEYLLREKK